MGVNIPTLILAIGVILAGVLVVYFGFSPSPDQNQTRIRACIIGISLAIAGLILIGLALSSSD